MNCDRDYIRKRAQYAAIAILEYVIIDPEQQTVTVLVLEQDSYREAGCYRNDQPIVFSTFPSLNLTPNQIFTLSI